MADIEFDPAKDEIDRAKHGLPLGFGMRLFADAHHLVLSSIRPIDGEDRYKVVGMVDGKLDTGVHVMRGELVRFLSVRRSNDGEQRVYHRDPG